MNGGTRRPRSLSKYSEAVFRSFECDAFHAFGSNKARFFFYFRYCGIWIRISLNQFIGLTAVKISLYIFICKPQFGRLLTLGCKKNPLIFALSRLFQVLTNSNTKILCSANFEINCFKKSLNLGLISLG